MPATSSSHGTTESITILVVDDERIIRELCCRGLSEYRVIQAANIDDAYFLFEREPCDIVLSDIMMPGGSGIELLKKIKEFDPRVIVMLMTGFAEKDVILEALKEGADDFINKPINPLQLKTSITKALSRKRIKDELDNLKRLDRLKSNFLSLISHKFRTPITSISLLLQNIQRGIYPHGGAEFMESVRMAGEEAGYLERMVSDLLAFSRVMVSDEEMRPDPCDVNLVLADILNSSREAKVKPGMVVDFQKGDIPLIMADREKIVFALRQIIDNAVKFSGENVHVTISTSMADERVFVIVSDSGIGIPSDEIPKTFEKFYQIDPDNTGQVRGFGLGLFYAREFIRQHGGSISIGSEPGLGTTVTVTLPVRHAV